MKKMQLKWIGVTFLITLLLITTNISATEMKNDTQRGTTEVTDFDPLGDVEVFVEIKQIRAFDTFEFPTWTFEKIDLLSKPDFYVKIFINDEQFQSEVWKNTAYIYDSPFTAKLNVPDDEELVNITIQLWDQNIGFDRMCDISTYHYDGPKDKRDVQLWYSIKTGHWMGDDWNDNDPTGFDPSGYGRLNGCDDNSIYERDRDCELLFNIYQTDPDGDGIPSWTETNVYGTDPGVDDTGRDDDNDGVPIE